MALLKKQITFLNALVEAKGIVSLAASMCGITRDTHYHWMKNPLYPEYKEQVNAIAEDVIDYVENALLYNIETGDQSAISYYLNAKAKHRGYGSQSDGNNVTINNNTVGFSYIEVSPVQQIDGKDSKLLNPSNDDTDLHRQLGVN